MDRIKQVYGDEADKLIEQGWIPFGQDWIEEYGWLFSLYLPVERSRDGTVHGNV